jgi:hypothetical protein
MRGVTGWDCSLDNLVFDGLRHTVIVTSQEQVAEHAGSSGSGNGCHNNARLLASVESLHDQFV